MNNRRHWLSVCWGLWPASWLGARALDPEQEAQQRQAQAAIRDLLAGRPISPGKVTLEIPPLVENGNSVVTQVSVSERRGDALHVQRIHLIAEGNPLPQILKAHFTPATAHPAVFSTRIRLANTQRVWALAEWSDGLIWAGSADTIVTLSSCTEER
ncbi:MAG: thiosulfate oxidation carrier protein SoxY [Alphaproteobacteria bacterium]|nr:thiosulfate oxidation carrier protein SoxY [Alphaproteobacteria bacterium]